MADLEKNILKQQLDDTEKEIERLKHQNTRLENRCRYLQSGERKKRTHHLCNMGGAIQAISPQADALSKSQFYSFMEQVFALPEVQKLLDQTSYSES